MINMTRATILDFPWIWEMVKETNKSDKTFIKLKKTLSHPECYYWKDPLESVVMIFFPAEDDIYAMHIYTKKEARGRYAYECAMSAGCNMIKSKPNIQCFFNIVKKQDRHLKMFMGYIGATRAVTLPNGSVMFVFTTDRYDEVIQRIGD